MTNFFEGYQAEFVFRLILSLVAGIGIGMERESRGKAAGISTQSFVIGGSMMFTYFSLILDPLSPARVAAQIVTGIGFLGAGIILKNDHGRISNLTTAAAIWFAAAIGIAIGMGYYFVSILAMIYALLVPRIPQFSKKSPHHHDR